MWIATTEEMRATEEWADSQHGLTPENLMEEAGHAVVRALKMITDRHHEIWIFCGPGNNGGDGFACARLAKERGFDVRCFSIAPRSELGTLCQLQMERAEAWGVPISFESWPSECQASIVIDAVFGTGLNRKPSGVAASAIEFMNKCHSKVLSIDVPSGINANTGADFGLSVMADRTVVLGMPKPAMFQGEKAENFGHWTVSDLGIPEKPTNTLLLDLARAKHRFRGLSFLNRHTFGHKGSSGRVVVFAGCDQYRGAAVLACLGALRAGTGLLTLVSTPSVLQNAATHLPEVILVNEDDKTAIELACRSANSIVFGPGLVRNHLPALFNEMRNLTSAPVVLDAEALKLLSEKSFATGPNLVITPHPGEAAKLLNCTPQDIQNHRFDSARRLSDKYQCSVILKGAFSIATCPGELLYVNSSGNPGMATGGMGDVLSGVVGAILAIGGSPIEASTLAMLWHGMAGDTASKEIAEIGFSASQLAQFLPRVRSILSK